MREGEKKGGKERKRILGSQIRDFQGLIIEVFPKPVGGSRTQRKLGEDSPEGSPISCARP